MSYLQLPGVDDGNSSDPEVTSKKVYEPSDGSDSDAEPPQRLLGFGQREPTKESSKESVDKGIEALSGLLSKFGQESRKELGNGGNKENRKESDKEGSKGKRKKSDQQAGYESEPEAGSSQAAASSSGTSGLFGPGRLFASNPLGEASRISEGQQASSREAGAPSEPGREKSPAVNSRNEDEPMTDAQKEAEAEGEGPFEHEKATEYTKEQREAVSRIRQCSKKDFYRILNLEESCTESDIKKAYRLYALGTHPDKNPFPDAIKAFKMVSRAYQVLSNPGERAEYEEKRRGYRLKGELDPLELWGEEFAENASGADSDDSDQGDDSEDEEEAEPDEYRKNIYRKATPWVIGILEDPDNLKIRSEIEALNKEITKRNKEEGLRENGFHIKLGFLVALALDFRFATQKKDQNALLELADQLIIWMYNNSYPAEWLTLSDDNLKKRRDEIQEKKREEQKKREGKMNNSKGKGKGKGREDDDADSRKKNEKKKPSFSAGTEVRKPKPQWKPGETRKGEKILGYRPFEKTNYITDEKSVSGYQFVIEKKGQPNPIALASGEDVGRRAVRAYIALPKKEKNDIRYSENKYGPQNADNFVTILGYASNPFKTWTKGSNRKYPNGYALWEFRDGSTDLVSRQCMRDVLGKTDADNEIAEFYEDIDEIPSWKIRPRLILHKEKKPKWLTSGREKSRRSIRDADSDSDSDSDSGSESDSDSESRRRSVRRKKKQKRLAGGRETKKRRKSRKDADSDDDSDSDSDFDSDSESRRRSVRGKKKTKRHAKRRARDDESADEDSSTNARSSNRRRASRKSNDKGKSKPKADGSTSNSSVLNDIMQNFINQMAEQNKIQTDNMAKQFQKAMQQLPVAATA